MTVRYIRGMLYVHGAKGYMPALNEDLQFTATGTEKRTGFITYISPRIYMRSELYRLMVDIDNKIYQRDFFLKPRSVQKLEKEFNNAQVISINHTPLGAIPVSITFDLRDSSSGKTITDEVDCFINYYNHWVKWQDFIKKPASREFLESGKTYFFRFQNQNYFNRIVSIDVLPHQAEVNIQAELVPLPGTLLIKSSEPGVELLINNALYYMDGGYNTRFSKLEPLSSRVMHIVLSPNTYYITARIGGLVKTESIDINPKKYTRIIVNVDKGKNTIDFNIF